MLNIASRLFPRALALLLAACTVPAVVTASPSPTATRNIERGKIDIAYTAFVDQSVFHVTSKKALEAALDGVREVVRRSGGKDDVPTPAFEDVDHSVLADFRAFADAASALAAKVPNLPADELSTAAIGAMIKLTPDCHTYYVTGGRVIRSGSFDPKGTGSPAIPQGQVLQSPDEAGLQGRVLDGGIAYIRWTEFRVNGTYNVSDKVKAVMDKALAAGAKAWLFDLRGNFGGLAGAPETIASFFLNGEGAMKIVSKTGSVDTSRAIPQFHLPDQYQLPIALIQNDREASATEVFTLFLKETKRATVIGGRSLGCLGSFVPVNMADGSLLAVTGQEFVGAVTGAHYNAVGIPPDIEATDALAIDVAVKHLKEKVAAR